MMWFERDEFLWGVRFQRRFSEHLPFFLSTLSSFRDQRPASLASSYIRLVGGKRVPCGVKDCRGDPRQDNAIILKLQVPMHVWVIHKDAASQLCGEKFTVTSQGPLRNFDTGPSQD
ncbi:hypothetical protein TNCV_932501 [Trichonephila clavipes]|nr:hypothetical protein TNCV_932501 [Trichonephila clavipes]